MTAWPFDTASAFARMSSRRSATSATTWAFFSASTYFAGLAMGSGAGA